MDGISKRSQKRCPKHMEWDSPLIVGPSDFTHAYDSMGHEPVRGAMYKRCVPIPII